MSIQVANVEAPPNKYFRHISDKDSSCYYRVEDKEGNPIVKGRRDSPYGFNYNAHWMDGSHACFAGFVVSGEIPKQIHKITIYHPIATIPFEEKVVERYFRDLNDMGFPCTYKGNIEDNIEVDVLLGDYEWKGHLASTLTLSRLPWEFYGFPQVLEQYLIAMDEDPEADKLDVLQKSHKIVAYNSGHSITWPKNSEAIFASLYNKVKGNARIIDRSITKDELFDNFAKGSKVFGSGSALIHICWNYIIGEK